MFTICAAQVNYCKIKICKCLQGVKPISAFLLDNDVPLEVYEQGFSRYMQLFLNKHTFYWSALDKIKVLFLIEMIRSHKKNPVKN